MPVLRVGDAIPPTPLVDQRGAPFSFASQTGRTLVVAFVYTRCREANACSLISARLAQLQSRLGGAPIGLIEMSVDPLHDRPSVLRQYGKLFGEDPARWTLVTGQPSVVLPLERRLGVDVQSEKNGAIEHDDELLFVGPDGRIADRIGGSDWTSGEVLARARTIAGLPADPLERARLALVRGIDAVCGGGVSGISLGAAILIFVGSCAIFGIAASRAVLASVRR